MSNAPVYEIDHQTFWNDPYPDLQAMRKKHPIVYVPQLGATLFTRRDDIFVNEKKIELFSSDQPGGLMSRLMGQNMMRKDGEAHMSERKAVFPTVSPRTVKTVWKDQFEAFTKDILDEWQPKGRADMVRDIAMRISGEALRVVTGMRNMTWREMDKVSQGMIDGCANYAGNQEVEDHCIACSETVNQRIDDMIPELQANPDLSLLSVQLQAGLSREQYRANVKLAITGGQNEPRDVLAGVVWALLNHPEQLALIQNGQARWMDAFEEYSRWISPVGMSPRRVAQRCTIHDVTFEPDEQIFFMFGSANRDEDVFANPDTFDIQQDFSASIAFGAGPHFCAGAWAARSLVTDVALPMIFDRLPGLRLDGDTPFGGWAFRGPLCMPVEWGT